eukprot:sb/3472217/
MHIIMRVNIHIKKDNLSLMNKVCFPPSGCTNEQDNGLNIDLFGSPCSPARFNQVSPVPEPACLLCSPAACNERDQEFLESNQTSQPRPNRVSNQCILSNVLPLIRRFETKRYNIHIKKDNLSLMNKVCFPPSGCTNEQDVDFIAEKKLFKCKSHNSETPQQNIEHPQLV